MQTEKITRQFSGLIVDLMESKEFVCMKIVASFVSCVLLAGCAGLPALDQVEYSFLREHRYASIVNVSGQLIDGNADFHIHFLLGGDSREHEEVWNYYHAAEAWLPGEKKTVK